MDQKAKRGTKLAGQRTQLERAAEQLVALKTLYPQLAEIREALQKVVGEAQNGPPEGGADGSIDEQAWKNIRDVERELGSLLLALLFTTKVERAIPEGRRRLAR